MFLGRNLTLLDSGPLESSASDCKVPKLDGTEEHNGPLDVFECLCPYSARETSETVFNETIFVYPVPQSRT